MNKYILIFLFVFLSYFVVSVNAEQISIKLKNSLYGLAEYTIGDKDKPAVFIMHGILQTHRFSTVQRLGDYLSELGYTTLRPTISLGIDSRKRGLDCEAIHTHNMNNDIDEIEQWVNWILEKTNKPLILIGHSLGGNQLLAYLKRHKYSKPQIKKVMMISLAYFGDRPNSKATQKDIDRAYQELKENKMGLSSYGFTYCEKYLSTPADYISYFKWSKKHTTIEASKIKANLTLLFGSKDKRVDINWADNLKALGFDVHIIDGANHFFNDEHEFDMLDFFEENIDI